MKMKTLLIASVLTSGFLTSCVSSKVYKELEGKYADLKKEPKQLG